MHTCVFQQEILFNEISYPRNSTKMWKYSAIDKISQTVVFTDDSARKLATDCSNTISLGCSNFFVHFSLPILSKTKPKSKKLWIWFQMTRKFKSIVEKQWKKLITCSAISFSIQRFWVNTRDILKTVEILLKFLPTILDCNFHGIKWLGSIFVQFILRNEKSINWVKNKKGRGLPNATSSSVTLETFLYLFFSVVQSFSHVITS